MAIKINGTTVIHDNKRGDFSLTNFSSYTEDQLIDLVVKGGAVGDIVYNSTVGDLNFWDGTKWVPQNAEPGEQVFLNPGTFTWTAPRGVRSVSVVCVGGGGSGGYEQGHLGGFGGGLGWKNNIPVIPGQSYKVVVGEGGRTSTKLSAICISVIDECSPSHAQISADWDRFRSAHPNRPFWLLQPTGRQVSELKIPGSYYSDLLTNPPQTVSRDGGNPNRASDWFTMCDLSQVPAGTAISLAVDDSGSTRIEQVQASIDLFRRKCNDAGLLLYYEEFKTERWSTPHIRTLPEPVNSNGGSDGGDSYFISKETVLGGLGKGGESRQNQNYGSTFLPGGRYVGDGGGVGGGFNTYYRYSHGGAGAGGYSGNGGSVNNSGAGNDGQGGGGGAGQGGGNTSVKELRGGGGGGVGIYGQGQNGKGGGQSGNLISGGVGMGGSLSDGTGTNGGSNRSVPNGGFPGGGGGHDHSGRMPGKGGGGAVRIIWGKDRAFPTDNVGKT